MFILRIALLVLVSLCCSRRSDASERPTEYIGPIGKTLGDIAEKYEENGFSGYILIEKEGQVLLSRGCGYRDRVAQLPNTATTFFEIASLSKPITAMAVLKLQEEGLLDIHRPVRNYLPEVPDRYSDATVFHVLTHTAGIPRGGAGSGTDAKAAILAHLAEGPEFQPGQKVSYSNAGYAILAALVERVSGKSFEAYCRERIFRPAGMNETGFCGESLFEKQRCAIGYHGNGSAGRLPFVDPYPPYDQFGYEYRGMGGVVTTANDLLHFVHAISEGKVVSSASKTLMQTELYESRSCGWEIFSFEEGIRCIAHGGGVRGYASKLWIFPEQNATLILLSNNDVVDYAILPALYHALFVTEVDALSKAQLAVRRGTSTPDTEQIAPLLGRYRSEANMALAVAVEGGVFRARFEALNASPVENVGSIEATAIDIVRGLSSGDPEPLRKSLPERMTKWPEWPASVVSSQWPELQKGKGAFRSVELIGSCKGPVQFNDAEEWLYVWLRTTFADASVYSLLTFNDKGQMEMLLLDAQSGIFGADSVPTEVRRLNEAKFEVCPDGSDSVTIEVAEDALTISRGSLVLPWSK